MKYWVLMIMVGGGGAIPAQALFELIGGPSEGFKWGAMIWGMTVGFTWDSYWAPKLGVKRP